jgi:hypothetical protein
MSYLTWPGADSVLAESIAFSLIQTKKEASMTQMFAPPRHKLALLLVVCVSVLGGALLLGHARHTTPVQSVEIPSAEQHEDLPPVW